MKPRVLENGFPVKVICGHCPFAATVQDLASMASVIELGAVCVRCHLWLCPRCSGGVTAQQPRPQFLN